MPDKKKKGKFIDKVKNLFKSKKKKSEEVGVETMKKNVNYMTSDAKAQADSAELAEWEKDYKRGGRIKKRDTFKEQYD